MPSALVFFEIGSNQQSLAAFLLCLLSVQTYEYYAPFALDVDNSLNFWTQVQLLTLLFCVLAEKLGEFPTTANYLGVALLILGVVPFVIASYYVVLAVMRELPAAIGDAHKALEEIDQGPRVPEKMESMGSRAVDNISKIKSMGSRVHVKIESMNLKGPAKPGQVLPAPDVPLTSQHADAAARDGYENPEDSSAGVPEEKNNQPSEDDASCEPTTNDDAQGTIEDVRHDLDQLLRETTIAKEHATKEIQSRDETIARIKNDLSTKDRAVKQINLELASKDKALAEKKKTVALILSQKDLVISEKDERNAALEAKLVAQAKLLASADSKGSSEQEAAASTEDAEQGNF